MKKLALLLVVLLFACSSAFANDFADCQGCCSGHGGVACIGGVTKCADGTPLSSTCLAKGCEVCGTPTPTPTPKPTPTPFPTPTPTPEPTPFSYPTTPTQTANDINIASFNLQVFGVTKAGNEDVINQMAEIFQLFDIIAVQEIRDESGTSVDVLETAVDSAGADYGYIIGPRLGRTSSKEQYAYFFKTNTITVDEETAYTFDDSTDIFHREPYVAKFRAGDFEFVLINIHTDPDEATNEIDNLPMVANDAKTHFPNVETIIILGDFNADCSYYDEDDDSPAWEGYTWLVTDAMDTNFASSSCTYDRINTTSVQYYANETGVYLIGEGISDHFPVWSKFHTSIMEPTPTPTPIPTPEPTPIPTPTPSPTPIYTPVPTPTPESNDGGGGGGGCFVDTAFSFNSDLVEMEKKAPAFSGNTKSKKFHKRGCRYFDCGNCTAFFETRQEAIDAGYVPCKVCKP